MQRAFFAAGFDCTGPPARSGRRSSPLGRRRCLSSGQEETGGNRRKQHYSLDSEENGWHRIILAGSSQSSTSGPGRGRTPLSPVVAMRFEIGLCHVWESHARGGISPLLDRTGEECRRRLGYTAECPRQLSGYGAFRGSGAYGISQRVSG